MPFTVISCADILLVNLERVGFNLRNFDMTIVFKVRRLSGRSKAMSKDVCKGKELVKVQCEARGLQFAQLRHDRRLQGQATLCGSTP